MPTDSGLTSLHAMWRRRVAMCSLGAAILAFPAGLALGITGTLAQAEKAAPQKVAAETKATPAGLFTPPQPTRTQYDALLEQAKGFQRDYLDQFHVANACIRALNGMGREGRERVAEITREDRERRKAREQFMNREGTR